MLKQLLKTVVQTGRRELVAVLSCLVVILCTWGFLELADAVVEGESRALDERIILLLRQPNESSSPIGPPWIVELARDFTALGSSGVVTLVTLAVVGFLALDRRYGMMWLVLIATAGGAGLSFALKSFYDRPRPDLVPALAQTFTASFPSGHSMLSAVVYLTLGALLAFGLTRRRLKLYVLAVAVLVTILVGFTRVYLGVHYPSDVLAGWAAGFAWAAFCLVVAQLLQRRGVVEETQS
jgi:undecaprenyl-diphosphatase